MYTFGNFGIFCQPSLLFFLVNLAKITLILFPFLIKKTKILMIYRNNTNKNLTFLNRY